MRTLSDIKGEEALDIIAGLIDPISDICQDKALVTLIRTKRYAEAAKLALKNHKKPVLEILALIDGTPLNEYNPSIVEIPGALLNILNDPNISGLFTSQVQSLQETNSGPATENIEANEN